MSRTLTARVPGLLAVAGAGMVAALVTGSPELAVVATPFLMLIGVGLGLARAPQLTAEIGLERTRLLEGDPVLATVRVRNQGPRAVDLEVALAHTGRLRVDQDGPVAVHLAGASEIELQFVVRPSRWGAFAIGPAIVRARDPLRMIATDQLLGERVVLRAFPTEQRLRELVAPIRTPAFLGAHVSRVPGEGIEFADIRPFTVGDRVRQVNWRATARRGTLYVTQRHPEQAGDVALLLDTFAEARVREGGTLDDAVRAAAALARAHLARRDRVSLIDFGGTLHWLEPRFGSTQLYRIIDALLSSEIAFSYAWREVESLPRRVLPTSAVIIAITPLLDERSIRLITDLRRRRFDVSVVEVSPLHYVPAGSSDGDRRAYRLWRLQREALRAQLRELGIAVAPWRPGSELAPVIEEVNSFRRSARHLARV